MHSLTIGTGVLLCSLTLSAGAQDRGGNKAAPLVGRWKVEYTLRPSAQVSALQFEALGSGRGWFTPQDSTGSNLSVPVRGDAVWTRSTTRVTFSGDLNLPIGNVGYESIGLSFEGSFTSATVIKGTARVVDKEPSFGGGGGHTGRFTATRIEEDELRKAK